ncbi:sodium:proton antiporter [Kineobactrum sediminis]|uniref:Sodium:proton antiporter n=1 Tax=Kineobactrum sediminis TaxID=1905677 RepID=A0A2N5Y1K8_9GAMM|nr:complex I subunit 5 family protein [Kineobactrum sediminis]PLW82276.1 sodium:proton antiporter [Kineobactrum sediminis]
MSALLWLLVPGAPLLAVGLLWRWPKVVGPWLWLSCVPALLLSLWPPGQTLEPGVFWPGAAWGANDLIGRAWLAFSALLWACASRFALDDLVNSRHRLRFWVCWLLSLSGNLLLVIAQDAGSFYVGFSLMGLAAYGLIVHLPGPAPRQAGRIYLQLTLLSEMLIFAGLLLRIHEAGGSLELAAWQQVPVEPVTAVILLLGFGLKAGFWPLHVWLPLAHPAAPAGASAVLSGAMIKAGILGLWRFLPVEDPLLQGAATILLAVGAISAFYGVLLGLLQDKSKAALAYSSISQIGYLLIILSLAWMHPGSGAAMATLLALYGVHHGLAKGALFMGAGLAANHRLSTAHWLLMGLPAMALAGLPLTSGAAVKVLLKDTLYSSDVSQWLALLTAGSAATALLLLRALWLMWRSQPAGPRPAPPIGQLLPWGILCLFPALLPWLWPELRTALFASLPIKVIWSGLWPLLLAAALALAMHRIGWRIPKPLRTLPNPARAWSLRVKRVLQRAPVPSMTPELERARWRYYERQWNHLWHTGAVTTSAWIIALLLLLGWLS